MILCCLGCAIFGITEISTDGVEFDTGDASQDAAAPPAAPLSTCYDYAPPNAAAETFADSEPDPEIGTVRPDLLDASLTAQSPTVATLEGPMKGPGTAVIENNTHIEELD